MLNRLLNFRPPKSKAIKVVDEDPSEIYEIMVLNEKPMEFLPKEEELAGGDDVGVNGNLPDIRNEYFRSIFFLGQKFL
jgi:hypothetical protein